jgi:hypothetical protein
MLKIVAPIALKEASLVVLVFSQEKTIPLGNLLLPNPPLVRRTK